MTTQLNKKHNAILWLDLKKNALSNLDWLFCIGGVNDTLFTEVKPPQQIVINFYVFELNKRIVPLTNK